MIRIITDSASDITQVEAEKLNIKVLGLPIRFKEEEFEDGVTITPVEFYEKMIEIDELPKTSQIIPYRYEQEYLEAHENNDEVLVITVGSKFSGCYQSANTAALAFGNSVKVFDSSTASLALKILVIEAVHLRDEEKTLDEIITTLDSLKDHLHIIALLDTLEYLKKGGRISTTAAIAGMLIGIKPVICIKNGAIEVIGKARGSRSGNNMLMDFVSKHGPIDFEKPFSLGYTGVSSHKLDKYIKDSSSLYESFTNEFDIVNMGSAIGTYAGPNCIAFAYFDKQ